MPIDMITEKRDMGRALRNGMRLRCPHCGKGKLFRSYLKVADHCEVCGEALHHHRADDFPPYIAIFITGHLIIGAMLEMEFHLTVEPWIYVVTLVPLALILPMVMLPTIKGAVVAWQWAARMHGFDEQARTADPALPSYP